MDERPMDERTMPHTLEAERSVLGAILLHQDALHEATLWISPDDFYRDAHRRMFRHMVELSMRGEPIELVSLNASLRRTGELDEVGGPMYIAALVDGVPRSTNIAHYAQLVRRMADLRSVIHVGNRMAASAFLAEDETLDIIGQAETALFAIAERAAKKGFVSAKDLVAGMLEKLEVLMHTKSGITGLSTGYDDLDADTCGLQPGDLVLVAGRPSMGKTALAVNIAEHVARTLQQPVGVFSIEMSAEQLMLRSLAGAARVDSHRLRAGYLRESDWARLSVALGTIAESKLFIDETANIGVMEMRAKAKRLQTEHGLALLIVDYVQLMAGEDKRDENRTIELGKISRGLKIIARELHVPVIVVSQLSRAPELRADHRPMLSDLRESGSLEQDADVVLFLYRDEVYHPDKPETQGIAELIIAKQRNGPIGTVKLVFIREFTRFENLALEAQAADQRLPMGDR